MLVAFHSHTSELMQTYHIIFNMLVGSSQRVYKMNAYLFLHIFISEKIKRLLIPMNSLTFRTSCMLNIAMKSRLCIGERISPCFQALLPPEQTLLRNNYLHCDGENYIMRSLGIFTP